MRYYFAVLLAIVLLGAPWITLNYSEQVAVISRAIDHALINVAAVILHNPRTIAELQAKYNSTVVAGSTSATASNLSSSATTTTTTTKVRILIVPGHEPNYGGAEYLSPNGLLKERDMAVELAQNLEGYLQNNSHYEVFTTRDTNSWTPDFANYFNDQWNEIVDWQKASRQEMSNLIAIGSSTKVAPTVFHNTAPVNVALRLYGITKWANENNIDIVIHVHFNDFADHRSNVPGKYTGFSIYVPAQQYGNSTTTRVVASTIYSRLKKYNPVSDLPGESTGIVNEPELIAIGANNTSDAASMLIEYGYIYEPQFLNPDTRELALKDLAFQTYLGLQDFFDKKSALTLSKPYDTLILPHEWKSSMSSTKAPASDVFALQTALQVEGIYPPDGTNKNDCPRSGTIGACTRTAIDAFQKKYGITGETSAVGPQMLKILNDKFGLNTI